VRLLPGENTLRRQAWAQENRRTVERLSGGRVGYVHLPDTGPRGFEAFHRGVLGQRDRGALVIDERWNSGGAPADLLVEMLGRRALSAYGFRHGDDLPGFRHGDDLPFPVGIFEGPLVMVVNEAAGSGGDTLPWMFRRAGLGPLVGTTTMGAGIGGYVDIPRFVDGGEMSVPSRAFFDPRGEWGIENRGVEPDVPVEILPADHRAGRDPQLLRAVQEAMKALEARAPGSRRRPTEPPSAR
jgi:tricorn protease